MASCQDVINNQQYQSDENILCDDCDRMYSGDCPEHGPLEWIKTTRAADSTHYTPCIASLPDGLVLKESGIPGNDMGVFAARLIYKRTMFGPFEGKTITRKDQFPENDWSYAWDLLRDGIPSFILDGSDEKHSNWMRFVTYSRDRREQNLIAFQYRGQIYYRTFRDVYPGEELMVWYEDEYTCSLDELQIEYSKDQMPEFACHRCRLVFAGSTYLSKHHKFRCPDGPLHSTYGARTTGLVGALFRLPVAIANESWSSPVTNNNENKQRSENESHHGRRKNKPRKLPRPTENGGTWNPEQPFGPPPISDLSENEADVRETTTVLLPPEAQALDASTIDDMTIEFENNNTNYLKRLTSDEITPPQLVKKPKLDEGVIVEVDEHEKYPYVCGSCGKTFARPTWWAKHESGCFKAKEKENQGNGANVNGGVKSPVKKPRKEPYICSFCGKAFACPSWKERHEKTHTKHLKTGQDDHRKDGTSVSSNKSVSPPVKTSLPHVCQDCGKGFDLPSRLAKHRAAKHYSAKEKTTDTRKNVCRDCGRSFAVAAWLTRHRMKAHSNSFVTKRHICGVCGRSFAVESWLARHRKVHEEPEEQEKTTTSETSSQGGEKNRLPWVCGDCGLRFKFISWLKRHQTNNKHANGFFDKQTRQALYKWSCNLPGCSKSYKRKHHLSRHKLTHLRDAARKNKKEVKPESKAEAKAEVKTETEQKAEEMKEDTSDTDFVCTVCGKTFLTRRMYIRHKKRHTQVEVHKRPECSICKKVFDTKDLLNRHSKRIHGQQIFTESEARASGPPYPCRYCEKMFDEPLALGRHIAHHVKKERSNAKDESSRDKKKRDNTDNKPASDYPYECDLCGRRFAVAFWLTRHKSEHDLDHPHKCDECGRSFAALSWLTRHKRDHETAKATLPVNDDYKPKPEIKGTTKVYKCDICGVEFPWPSWLIKHRKLHKLKGKTKKKTKFTGIKKKTSPTDKTSKANGEENYEGRNANEMFRLVDRNGTREYECIVCKKSTVWHTGIIYHVRVHHTHEKPFECKICKKSFHMSGDLTKHNRRHAEEKSFYCRHCNKEFSTPQQVKKHETSHSQSKPFHCKYCGKGYRDRSSIWRHIARKTCPQSAQAIQNKTSATSVLKKAKKTLRSHNQNKSIEIPEKNPLAKPDRKRKAAKQDEPVKQVKRGRPPKQDKPVIQDKPNKQGKQAIKLVQQEKLNRIKAKMLANKTNKKKPLSCKNCNKTFPNTESFKAHIESYKKNNQIVCDFCGKCWVRTADLKRHLRVHTGERPFACPECGLAFKVSDALKRHMIKLHPRSKKQIIIVKSEQATTVEHKLSDDEIKQPPTTESTKSDYLCDSKCVDKTGDDVSESTDVENDSNEPNVSNKQPVSDVEDENQEEKDEKVSKKATRSKVVRRKKKTYKKSQCEYCGKLYSGPGNLTRHLRLHTGEKPFKCKECGESFMRSDILTHHIGRYHYMK